MARELLTASGSNFRVPPVNFIRAVQGRGPQPLAAAVALTFMGSRIETWPADRRAGMEALFSRVIYKPTAEWKEEIVCLDPAPTGPLNAVLPDGRKVKVAPGAGPASGVRRLAARPGKPLVRPRRGEPAWAWIFGRGIVHEPDDIRPDNPPAIPGC
jgi:hypothetical protein